MGRYDEDPSVDALREVRLLGVPVRVMLAAREHHDEVMREFALIALGDSRADPVLPGRLVELTQLLGVRYGSARARPDEDVEAALQRGEDRVDLTYLVPAHIVQAADTLAGLMAEADAYCRSEQLLTLARTDLLVAFADWYLAEFRRQLAGQPPRRWDGPTQP